jgi:hypothetical protein
MLAAMDLNHLAWPFFDADCAAAKGRLRTLPIHIVCLLTGKRGGFSLMVFVDLLRSANSSDFRMGLRRQHT